MPLVQHTIGDINYRICSSVRPSMLSAPIQTAKRQGQRNSTMIELSISMTDPAPVFQFSGIVGLARPSKPKPVQTGTPNHNPKWLKSVTGLRALRVLGEIQPFLFGEKAREVERALAFFSPTGYRQGHFRPIDIWPREEFPLRRRLEA